MELGSRYGALLAMLLAGVATALGLGAMASGLGGIAKLGAQLGQLLRSGAHAAAQAEPPAPPPLQATEVSAEAAAAATLPEPDEAPSSEPRVLAEPLSTCPGALRLIGSVVNLRKPERSLAAIDLGTGTRLVRPGEALGEYQLIALRSRRAYLRGSDDRLCELTAAAARGGAAAQPAPARAPAPAKGAPLTEAELKQGVTKLDERTYAVSRGLLQRVLEDKKLLSRSATLKLQDQAGGQGGMVISKLPKNSPLAALGFHKGDVLQSMNGQELASPAGALAALEALRTSGRVSVRVARGGTTEALTFIPR